MPVLGVNKIATYELSVGRYRRMPELVLVATIAGFRDIVMVLNANDITSKGSGSETTEIRTQLPSVLISDESVNPIDVVELPNPSSDPFPEL